MHGGERRVSLLPPFKDILKVLLIYSLKSRSISKEKKVFRILFYNANEYEFKEILIETFPI